MEDVSQSRLACGDKRAKAVSVQRIKDSVAVAPPDAALQHVEAYLEVH